MSESSSHTDALDHHREQTDAVQLSAEDREIAVKAICSRATGTTTQVATQILAGIAALDGRRLSILLWPEDFTREQKAAWHKSEAAFWDSAILRFRQATEQAEQNAQRTHEKSPSPEQTAIRAPLQQDSALTPEPLHAAGTENPRHRRSGERAPGASDAY
ncbi:hypothetical protein CFBP6411_03372 [Pseudomonas syringae group genomosp. 3]|uniref:Uncharacterized protein n=1 Tax=Pseudomonas syringae group genomosp. 3 TaxID=251701 RepID=A0A2K4WFR2_9PSED|nr:hypothetical protein [Pseudomonas syringae group genomosp. 3]SOS34729.1 hypothetical protein CFBP6411_03372 [Pseudomonas syringae group genomosp. 3]